MAERINVLYIVRTWAIGGGQTIVLSLLQHLDPERYNIIVATYDAPGDGDAKMAAAVERVGGTLAPVRIPWTSRREWKNARDTIVKLVKDHDIDLIHTHDPHSNVLVGMNRERFDCACVASPYGWWRRLFPLRSHIYVWLEKNRALPRFERVITVSQTMKRNILFGRTKNEKIRVVNTGLDYSALEEGRSRNAVRDELGIERDAVVVGTLGRVYVEKGHRYLIDAANRLFLSHPNLHLLIVGDGPQRAKLEETVQVLGIERRVTFTGYYDDLPGALRAMDIFALPTILDEGFPTSVLEAQAAGLPVIATDTGGTFETMDPGVTGLLVKPRDVAGLSQAIAALLNDDEKRHLMAKAGPEWVRSSFTLEGMMAAISQTYDEAVDEYHR